jgi:geranylgeranyl pyrophosphate synthase
LFLAATFGQFVHSRLLTAGTALELIHVASLHHDDVIDRAPLRRNGASANAQWGNQVAALAGNYLFARATSLLASLGETANQLAAVGIANLCAGQLQEVENTFNLELDEQQHFEILRRKTATLFTLPCHLGCRLAGVSTIQTTALLTYARELGIAFQLADDTLDFIGSAERLGKATGRDLREGVYSLPVLLALHSSGQVAEELNALLAQYTLTEADTIKAIRLVRESGAVHQSLGVAREHAGRALAALSGLPNSLARRSLERLAEYVVLRSS